MATGSSAHRGAYFGKGIGPIFGQTNCKVHHSSIVECLFPLGIHNCDHSNDAGVTCSGQLCLLYNITRIILLLLLLFSRF